jgi:hypothetical protein
MMPPRSLTARSSLPPEGGLALLGAALRGGVHIAPTFAHCVWLPAPRGGRALLGAALRGGK